MLYCRSTAYAIPVPGKRHDAVASFCQSDEECYAGGLLGWDEGEVNDVLSSKGPDLRKPFSGGPAKTAEQHDPRRGRDTHLGTSGEEEADDIFESEFLMLKDLWKFDSVPFAVAKQVRCAHSTSQYREAPRYDRAIDCGSVAQISIFFRDITTALAGFPSTR